MIDRTASALLIVLTGLFGLREWGVGLPPLVVQGTAFLIVALLFWRVRAARKAFVIAGLGLTFWLWHQWRFHTG